MFRASEERCVRGRRSSRELCAATGQIPCKILTDVEDRRKINPVRQEFFGAARPASTLIGVKALAIPEMKVEIEAVVGMRG